MPTRYYTITDDGRCPHCRNKSFSGLYGSDMRNCNYCFKWLIDPELSSVVIDDGADEVKD